MTVPCGKGCDGGAHGVSWEMELGKWAVWELRSQIQESSSEQVRLGKMKKGREGHSKEREQQWKGMKGIISLKKTRVTSALRSWDVPSEKGLGDVPSCFLKLFGGLLGVFGSSSCFLYQKSLDTRL